MRLSKSYQYLEKALKMGREVESQQVIGYASAWLTWTCMNLGNLDEAIYHGERAQEISRLMPGDQYLYFKSLAALGLTYFGKGEKKKSHEIGKKLLEYSRKHSNTRCMVLGYYITGFSCILNGDFSSAIEYGKKAAHIAADPLYFQIANDLLSWAYFYGGNFKEAEAVLNEIVSYSREYGCEMFEFYDGFLGVIQMRMVSLTWLGMKHKFCPILHLYWHAEVLARLRCLKKIELLSDLIICNENY